MHAVSGSQATTSAQGSAADASVRPIAPLACSAVLTHHWLVRVRGGEKVLAALYALLPDSPLYTLVYDDDALAEVWAAAGLPAAGRRVVASFFQRLPTARRHHTALMPLMPWAYRRMRLPPVDLVVCSDAGLAKAMRPHARSRLVCYCHSPPRYAWEPEIRRAYTRTLPAPLRPLFDAFAERLRRADAEAARRVDQFVANSRHVAERIRRHYGRDSVVVHPPVDVPAAPAAGPRERFYLCVGQHVPYKRLDLAVAACRRLGRELVVIGEGPDAARLARRLERGAAAARIHFLGRQPDEVVVDHYRRARALLFPGEEDFGIVPVEAMAHGCPVVAYGVGGAAETVVDGVTGVLFAEQNPEGLVAAIDRLETMAFDPQVLHAHARRFGRPRFLRELRAVLVEVLARGPRPTPGA